MSKTIQKKIDDCTNEELRTFANVSQGLSVPANANRAVILAKLQAVWTNDYVTLTEVERAEHPPLKTVNDDEYVTVIIAKTEEVGGADPVWLSVNGRGQFVERGKQQRIRKPYEEVLRHAVRIVYDQDMSGAIPGPMMPREVFSYPYQIVPNVVANAA